MKNRLAHLIIGILLSLSYILTAQVAEFDGDIKLNVISADTSSTAILVRDAMGIVGIR